jgi:mRNA-degrading endonuclease RelE of RelBE toxin-antitoxin system
MAEPYAIIYRPEAADDLRGLRAFDARAVTDTVEQHLAHEPTLVSRSRIKLMNQPFWSQYRLRIGELRAYYDVDEASRVVSVLRIRYKGTGGTSEEP